MGIDIGDRDIVNRLKLMQTGNKTHIILSMILVVLFLLILLWLASVINRFVIQPKKRMQRYQQYKGLTLMPFIPVVGAFKLAEESY
jgi:hypothetical protein